MENNIDLDLDTLLDDPVHVKINGIIIDVYPPSVQDIFTLTSFMKRFRSVDQGETEESVEKLMSDFQEMFVRIIPQLENHKMTFKQLFKLLQFVMSIASSQEVGPKIEIVGQEKKALNPEPSSESSQDFSTTTQATQLEAS